MLQRHIETVKTVKLFDGIEEESLRAMLGCLGPKIIKLGKGGFILNAGEPVSFIGIVLSGRLNITREDADGRRAIIAAPVKGDYFGEALCCAQVAESPVSVIAAADSEVMLLSFTNILNTCKNSCAFHTRLISNTLRTVAQKSLQLQRRMEIIGKKTIRQRILAYFESEGQKWGKSFTIPFKREEFADFLCSDRSALSRELSNMKRDGVIDYNKNKFMLLPPV